MITAILILGFLEIFNQIISIFDLFSTLQKNLIVNFITIWLGSFAGYVELKFIVMYDGPLYKYFIIATICSTIAAATSVVLVKYASHLKNLLRKKKISKSMKKRWEDKKNENPKDDSAGTAPDSDQENGSGGAVDRPGQHTKPGDTPEHKL